MYFLTKNFKPVSKKSLKKIFEEYIFFSGKCLLIKLFFDETVPKTDKGELVEYTKM